MPFRDFMGGQYGGNAQISQAALAKEVLAEIPDQVVQYMLANKIAPKPPRPDVLLPSSPTKPTTRTKPTTPAKSGTYAILG